MVNLHPPPPILLGFKFWIIIRMSWTGRRCGIPTSQIWVLARSTKLNDALCRGDLPRPSPRWRACSSPWSPLPCATYRTAVAAGQPWFSVKHAQPRPVHSLGINNPTYTFLLTYKRIMSKAVINNIISKVFAISHLEIHVYMIVSNTICQRSFDPSCIVTLNIQYQVNLFYFSVYISSIKKKLFFHGLKDGRSDYFS